MLEFIIDLPLVSKIILSAFAVYCLYVLYRINQFFADWNSEINIERKALRMERERLRKKQLNDWYCYKSEITTTYYPEEKVAETPKKKKKGAKKEAKRYTASEVADCERKKPFTSPNEARKALRSLKRARYYDGKACRVYKCPVCRKYHLSHGKSC